MSRKSRKLNKQLRKIRIGCLATMIMTFVIMCSYAFGMYIKDTVNASVIPMMHVSEKFGLIEPFPGKENVVDASAAVETVDRNITIVITTVETEEVVATETEEEVVVETEEVEVTEEIKLFPEEKLDLDIQRHMYFMCEKYNIPMEIVMALAFNESTYNPEAVGKDGEDHGLCQIRTNNHQKIEDILGRDLDFFDPYDNIEAACLMLSNIRNRNKGKNWEYILLCYNRGETGAKKYVERYGVSTSSYTHDVLTKARELGYQM